MRLKPQEVSELAKTLKATELTTKPETSLVLERIVYSWNATNGYVNSAIFRDLQGKFYWVSKRNASLIGTI